MDWDVIRRHYAARLAHARRSGLTQQAIATAGQLPGQNAISKLLANHNLGPSVGTFVKAVTGLGLDVSAFFAEIEHCGRSTDEDPRVRPPTSLEHLHVALLTTRFELHELGDRLDRIERTLARLATDHGTDRSADPQAPAAGAPPRPRSRGVA